MSDRTYAKLQTQQKTLTGPSPSSRLLQRKCACGGSPGIDGLCNGCRDQQLTMHASQRTLGSLSTSALPKENADSGNLYSGGASHFGHDFSQIPTHSTTQVARQAFSTEEYGARLGVPVQPFPTPSHTMDIVQRAATDNSRPLDESVRLPLEQSLGHNLSQVRVHYGPASSRAAEHFSARAYTLDSDIYLGQETHQLSRPQYNRLLAHEAIHTVQQGGRPVAPQAKLEVSRPTDTAEIEADYLAESIISSAERPPASRSLALRDQIQVTPATSTTVSRLMAPLIQRDLKGTKPANLGRFVLDLETTQRSKESNWFTGLRGTIKFFAYRNPITNAPDSKKIRLLQIAKMEILPDNKPYMDPNLKNLYTGHTDNEYQETEHGYRVDINPKKVQPRAKEGDTPVSPYYNDYYHTETKSQDGSKNGENVKEASLFDFPQWNRQSRFFFETAAIGDETTHYATLKWGFTIINPEKGLTKEEQASVLEVPSPTFKAAVTKFDAAYKNPGALTAH